MNRIIFLGLICCFQSSSYAQDYRKDGWLMYERGFEFTKGIYVSFNDFKTNAPSIQGEFEKRNGMLYVKNDSSGKWSPFRRQHWGFSNGKNIYIKTYGGYTRIGLIGELSYFGIASTGGGPTSVALSSAGGIGLGVGMGSSSANTSEYLLDFVSGQFILFTKKNFETILKTKDPLLFEQYKKRKGKKKEKMHLYLNAYNDKYPIYFPK